MKQNITRYLPLCGLSLLAGAVTLEAAAPKNRTKTKSQQKMNVLFIMSDDMRTDWKVYGTPQMHTPNFDKLASEGVLFQHNYCQYPLSGPSRTSMLSGHRPVSTRIYDNSPWWGADHPEWPSLPMYFKKNGYTTYVSGKIFHSGIEDSDAWDFGGWPRMRSKGVGDFQPSYVSDDEHRIWVENHGGGAKLIPVNGKRVMGPGDEYLVGHGAESDQWGASETRYKSEDENTDKAIGYIQAAAKKKEPFFIACGYSKPHSPFICPQRFFDLYNVNDIPLAEDYATYPMVPRDFPAGAIRDINADLFINRRASPEEAKQFTLAYWACISYVDWNVGRLIDALDAAGLRDNTIIVFCVDHGFMMGEKGKWSKAGSLWEEGTNVPLVIVDPRAKGNGKITYRITENLDIYPTLIELCGLPKNQDLEGISFASLLNDPDAEFDHPAYSVWNNHGKGVTGVAIRTEHWRYAEYYGAGRGKMLIDEVNDPHELVNLANEPQNASLVAKFHEMAEEYVKGQRELTAEEAAAKTQAAAQDSAKSNQGREAR